MEKKENMNLEDALDTLNESMNEDTLNEKMNQDFEETLKKEEEKYKRLFAEFDNYKKRTQKEREKTHAMVKGDLILDILPIVDALEQSKQSETTDEAYKAGIDLVYAEIQKFLDKNNVKSIGEPGEKFNPELHQAIQTQPSDEYESGEIVLVYRKGYMIGDKVIRHAMVIVAQ